MSKFNIFYNKIMNEDVNWIDNDELSTDEMIEEIIKMEDDKMRKFFNDPIKFEKYMSNIKREDRKGQLNNMSGDKLKKLYFEFKNEQ